ncbi:spartin-like isoform X2 [Acipenser ruthenus]|uniref:spartin-like isoform X2 n=1 Tax=Acipenser ruthenus TaxID=7906 RepID=UPI0027407449|nr:spartin-like isoform X2 [Acipenser ruthenus]
MLSVLHPRIVNYLNSERKPFFFAVDLMMEKVNPEAFEDARHTIRDVYKKAFTLINKGLSEDEAGRKEQAIDLYRQGRQQLLRGVSIPSQGPENTGPAWESAREMQEKMQETLNNISTRLRILETGEAAAAAGSSNGIPGSCAANGSSSEILYPALPSKEKPTRPVPPKVLFPEGDPPGAGGSKVPSELPPAYSPQAAEGHYTLSYGTDGGELSMVGGDFYSQNNRPPPMENLGADGEELLLIQRGVQIFFVTSEGHVTAPSYPGYLRIIKFTSTDSVRAANQPPAFLQVCDWLYPLMSTASPVLLCNTGVYMFPDVMAQTPGSYVGVVLSSELPDTERALFQDLLSQLTDLRVQPAEAASDSINLSQRIPLAGPEAETEDKEALPEWSEKVAHGILTGASWLSWGLVKGAEFTGKAIHKGASKLREHISPEDKPAHVSPTMAKSLHVAKQATGGAVKVSQFLVDGVCSVASCVGKELAPHVKKHGSKLIPESMKRDKDGKSNMGGAMVVAASGMQGFATVWTGLEVAAKSIAKSVASETVHTVKHKYGAAAGQATDNAVNSAVNVGVAAFNIDNLGIKAVVKKTGKETASAILEDYKIREKQEKQLKKEDK